MLGCPKLTPLQSRFAASLAALGLIALIYWSLSSPTFAYAAELALDGSGVSRSGEDHNWHRIVEERLAEDGVESAVEELKTRATGAVMAIGGNNVGNLDNIEAGQHTVWMYSTELLNANHTPTGPGLPPNVQPSVKSKGPAHEDLRKRDDTELRPRQDSDHAGRARRIYVSINTCLQPTWSGEGLQTVAPPPLTLYLSNSSLNTNPGPHQDPRNGTYQVNQTLVDGFANLTVVANDTWYMAVTAPTLPKDFTGVWNYELAVSIDDYFHQAHANNPNLYLIDSDGTAALLMTGNLTQSEPGSSSYEAWLDLSPPYIVFASNENHTRVMGLGNSYCGLSMASQIVADQSDPEGISNPVHMDMTTSGLGNKPKERFYITNLNISSTYRANLALLGNSTASGNGVVGGGGTVWSRVNFGTKADGNCALIYNLTFCSEVAYAVPSTPDFTSNQTNFHHFYDNYTLFYYQQFNYSLQQIPCNTTAAAQYSLAQNCDNCATAYKQWLCAVSIPRCADFSRPDSDNWLQPRNMAQAFYNNASFLPDSLLNAQFIPMSNAPTLDGSPGFTQTYVTALATNSSRNPLIDAVIAPGPYKEVLPCDDLCYNLARACPMALGFTCPSPGQGLEMGYGKRNTGTDGTITCSYPGAYVLIGEAGGLRRWSVAGYVALGLVVGLIGSW